jgi:hypothetical protein
MEAISKVKGIYSKKDDGTPLIAKNGQPYLKLSLEDGEWFNIFETKMAEYIAKLPIGQAVKYTFEQKGDFKNIKTIEETKQEVSQPKAQLTMTGSINTDIPNGIWIEALKLSLETMKIWGLYTGNDFVTKPDIDKATDDIVRIAHKLLKGRDTK